MPQDWVRAMRGGGLRDLRLVGWGVLVILAASSCGIFSVAPMGADGRPSADEQALWAQADKEEQALAKKTKAYDDPVLEAYLGRLGNRLLGERERTAGGSELTFRVLEDPTLNAFAMPNGHVYIHTGLLSAVGSEAELAMILGRELAHLLGRHAFAAARGPVPGPPTLAPWIRVAAAVEIAVAVGASGMSAAGADAAVLSPTANAVAGLGLRLVARAAITGYGLALEREADADGIQRIAAAGYDPTEAVQVFARLMRDAETRGPIEMFFLGNHARLQERVDEARRLLRKMSAPRAAAVPPIRDREEFELRMRTVVRDNARLDIRVGRFELARAELDRVLRVAPEDPTALRYDGEIFRLEAQWAHSPAEAQRLAQKARTAYLRAAQADPSDAEPYRELGFLAYQERDMSRARTAFDTYLALNPRAVDGVRIREYLLELNR